MKSNYYAVIMAGGVGSRFWPKSRKSLPKQFQDFMGSGKTLLQHTVDRLRPLIPEHQILILTNESYMELVHDQLPELHSEQIILEPCMRNTAPCLLLSALKIQKMNPEAQILVAPSDHWINESELFLKDLELAFNHCLDSDDLMTFGIKPAQPHTGYGYLKVSDSESQISKVEKFTEKPNYETAEQFISTGEYFWNSGIFAWNVKTILEAFKKKKPEMFDLFNRGFDVLNTPSEKSFLDKEYQKSENISIDYAVMEQYNNVAVVQANFNWNDLGTWNSLYDQLSKDDYGNAVVGASTVLKGSAGNMIHAQKDKLIVLEGLENFVIVDNKDVLLIYPKGNDQGVKNLLKETKTQYGDQYE